MTETIDRLYLELSNLTTARHRREIDLATMVMRLTRALKKHDPKSTIAEAAVLLVERHGLSVSANILREPSC